MHVFGHVSEVSLLMSVNEFLNVLSNESGRVLDEIRNEFLHELRHESRISSECVQPCVLNALLQEFRNVLWW